MDDVALFMKKDECLHQVVRKATNNLFGDGILVEMCLQKLKRVTQYPCNNAYMVAVRLVEYEEIDEGQNVLDAGMLGHALGSRLDNLEDLQLVHRFALLRRSHIREYLDSPKSSGSVKGEFEPNLAHCGVTHILALVSATSQTDECLLSASF